MPSRVRFVMQLSILLTRTPSNALLRLYHQPLVTYHRAPTTGRYQLPTSSTNKGPTKDQPAASAVAACSGSSTMCLHVRRCKVPHPSVCTDVRRGQEHHLAQRSTLGTSGFCVPRRLLPPHQPQASSRQPPACSHQPPGPAASRQPPPAAASRQSPTTSNGPKHHRTALI